jgi:hypothetical protein
MFLVEKIVDTNVLLLHIENSSMLLMIYSGNFWIYHICNLT